MSDRWSYVINVSNTAATESLYFTSQETVGYPPGEPVHDDLMAQVATALATITDPDVSITCTKLSTTDIAL